jgi:hypothetical protein
VARELFHQTQHDVAAMSSDLTSFIAVLEWHVDSLDELLSPQVVPSHGQSDVYSQMYVRRFHALYTGAVFSK